jgi:SAM-dependent methyltransferase
LAAAFCTIITTDYLHYALALKQSLDDFGESVQLYIFITNDNEKLKPLVEEKYPGTFIISTDEVCADGIGKKIYSKYHDFDINAFRWSMKPVFIKHLLNNKGYEKVIFLDADLFFFGKYQFLIDELDYTDMLLTPDWRSSNPHKDLVNFQKLYKEGIYNGGFIGANKNAMAALDWWAMACEFACINDPYSGMYYDQIHLNMLPVYFEKTGIVRHKGCNVANWNMTECKRTKEEMGEKVLIENKYSIVFIHFSTSTVAGIINGEDPLLTPYLNNFFASLNKYSLEIEESGIRALYDTETKDAEIEEEKRENILNSNFTNNSFIRPVSSFSHLFKGNVLNLSAENRYDNYLPNSMISDYISLDIKSAWQYEANPSVKPLWNGIEIPFETHTFDTVLGIGVLKYSPDPLIILREINRILNKEGIFFFTVPYLDTLSKNDKIRYTPYHLKKLLTDAGFVNIQIKPIAGWHASMAQMLELWLTRSALIKKRKKVATVVLKPVINYLRKLERFNKTKTEEDNQMVTGFEGVAFKN